MPVHPDLPEPLREALESMERQVQDAKRNLAYAAPELHDTHWGTLQEGLADTLIALYNGAE